MKHIKRFLMIAIAFVLLIPLNVHAAYSYTITLYAGNVGTFSDGSTTKTYTVDLNGEVNFQDDIKDVVLTGDNAKTYYVKGVREAGKDNNTVSATRFTVTSDREYVIAYGIKGNMVPYTISYVDRSTGATLYPSQTFYGVVGDKPVVAYQYVDGYQPEAYNMTGTLKAEGNEWTFYYNAKPTSTETVIDEGTTNNGSTTNRTNTTTNNGTTTDNNTATGDNSNSEVTDDNNNTATDENGGEESNVDENGTQDIVDLDDNDTPLENINADDSNDTDKNMLVYIGVAVVAIAALVGFLFFVFKKKKKEDKQ